MATSASDVISPRDNMDDDQSQARADEYAGKAEDDDPIVWLGACGCIVLVACWCAFLWKCAPIFKGERKIVSVSFKGGLKTERVFQGSSSRVRRHDPGLTPTEDRYRAESVGEDGLDGVEETQRTEIAIPGMTPVSMPLEEGVVPLGGLALTASP